MKSSSGEYAFKTADNKILPVGKLDVDLTNSADVANVMNRDDVTKEAKERIKEMSEKAINDKQKVTATIFSSELLSATNDSYYYVYNGCQMRYDRIYYYDLSTETKKVLTGSGTANILKSVFSLGFDTYSTLGNPPATVGAIGFAGSIYSFFEKAYNYTVTGSTQDYAEFNFTYNNCDELVYAQIGGQWYCGFVCQQVYMKQVNITQYYYYNNTGHRYPKSFYPNQLITSPHFYDPWVTAFTYAYNPKEEWIVWDEFGYVILFN